MGRRALPSLALLLMWLTGCHAQHATSASSAASIRVGTQLAAEQILSRTLDSAPPLLDPSLITDVPSQFIMDDLFEGLTTLAPDGRVVPGVASRWDVSADGLTWVFHLRPQARWSDGSALTADDFVYAWRRTVDPSTRAEDAQQLAPILHGLEVAKGERPPSDLGVSALDTHTLRVQLAAPTPYLPQLLTNSYLQPLRASVIRRYGDDWTRPEHMVSDGPFMLRENVIGSRLTLDKNPYYWDAANVKLQRVIYYVLEDRTTQAQRFLAGQVQFIQTFPTTDLPYLRERLGTQVVSAPYFGTLGVGLNVLRPPFKGNRALRLALNLAVDREMIAQHVLNGAGFPAYTLVPPLPDYAPQIPDWARLSVEARHELARRYYREAGYSAAHPMRAELSVSSGDSVTTLTYEALIAMWRENLGAQVSLHQLEFKILIQDRRLKKPDMFHDAWIGDYLDPVTFLQLRQSGSDLNNSGYADSAFDAMIDLANQQAQLSERYRHLGDAEHLLDDDASYIPVYYYSVRHLAKPYLKGWEPNILDRNLSRYMYLLEHEGD